MIEADESIGAEIIYEIGDHSHPSYFLSGENRLPARAAGEPISFLESAAGRVEDREAEGNPAGKADLTIPYPEGKVHSSSAQPPALLKVKCAVGRMEPQENDFRGHNGYSARLPHGFEIVPSHKICSGLFCNLDKSSDVFRNDIDFWNFRRYTEVGIPCSGTEVKSGRIFSAACSFFLFQKSVPGHGSLTAASRAAWHRRCRASKA